MGVISVKDHGTHLAITIDTAKETSAAVHNTDKGTLKSYWHNAKDWEDLHGKSTTTEAQRNEAAPADASGTQREEKGPL